MSLRSLVPVSLFVCLVAPALAQQPPSKDSPPPAHDTAKGASLMAEARKALGGDDKLAAIKRLEIKGSSTQVTAQQTLEGDLTMQIESPDKMKIEREIELPGGSISITQTQGLNGAEVWDATDGNLPGGLGGGGRGGGFRGGGGGGGRLGGLLGLPQGQDQARGLDPARAAALQEAQRKTRQTDLARYLVAFLAAPGDMPAWIGTAVTPKDEKADVLEFTTPDGTTTRLFLDITTHMPLMMTYQTNAPRTGGGGRGRRGGSDAAGGGAAAQGGQQANPQPNPQGSQAADAQGGRRGGAQPQQVTMELYLGDYKPEGAIKLPHHITRELGGEIQEEINIKSVKLNPNFKANTFTQPK
ncbi:MAG TPA: hypothetical protein VL173_02325 [Vicinamibacterales bacterium]|nr:hypothetical protein [Vicinamibacterales bacterium]